MIPVDAKTPEELLDALLESSDEVTHVNRKVLIETVGIERAQLFLPKLPDTVAVNAQQVLLVSDPTALTEATKRHDERNQPEPKPDISVK